MKTYIKTLSVLSDEDLDLINPFIENRRIKKGDYLITEGQICKEIAFIKQGMLRSFFVNEKGEEITNCISFENDLMNAYSSFVKQEPTQENIQAIINTDIQFISKKNIEKLFHTSNGWQKVGRILAEIQYLNLENRILSFQKDSATTRYLNLSKSQPQYIKQIPQHYIASFLGITTRHLTRIRKTIL